MTMGKSKEPWIRKQAKERREKERRKKNLTFISDSLSLSRSVPGRDVSVLGNWLIPDDPQIQRTLLNIKGDQIMSETSRLQIFLDLFNFHC